VVWPWLVCSFAVSGADQVLARRQAAVGQRLIAEEAAILPAGNQMWFEGHWGFQFYMEKMGATALDVADSPVKKGDILVLPLTNSNIYWPSTRDVQFVRRVQVVPLVPIAVMNQSAGAGYYSSQWGGLPFGFWASVLDEFYVFRFTVSRQGII